MENVRIALSGYQFPPFGSTLDEVVGVMGGPSRTPDQFRTRMLWAQDVEDYIRAYFDMVNGRAFFQMSDALRLRAWECGHDDLTVNEVSVLRLTLKEALAALKHMGFRLLNSSFRGYGLSWHCFSGHVCLRGNMDEVCAVWWYA